MKQKIAAIAVVVAVLGSIGAHAALDDPYARLQWGLRRVQAPSAWSMSRGQGAIVAVVDTGVDARHPDLHGRVLPGYDFVDHDRNAADGSGHGTLVAGIIASATGRGVGGAGVAPASFILPVRVLGEDGLGRAEDAADGIRWAARHGADVINVSLAHSGEEPSPLAAAPAVLRAIDAAARAGALVVVAAGNDPTGGGDRVALDPSHPSALVVGATTRSDLLAAYSNHGIGLDLVAPGGGSAEDPRESACTERTGVVGAWWNPSVGVSSYGVGCGTSMAAAFVSGGAAALRSLGLDAAETASLLRRSTRDLGDPGPDMVYGAGLLDVERALQMIPPTLNPDGPSWPPRSDAGRVAVSSMTVSPAEPDASVPSGPIAAIAVAAGLAVAGGARGARRFRSSRAGR